MPSIHTRNVLTSGGLDEAAGVASGLMHARQVKYEEQEARQREGEYQLNKRLALRQAQMQEQVFAQQQEQQAAAQQFGPEALEGFVSSLPPVAQEAARRMDPETFLQFATEGIELRQAEAIQKSLQQALGDLDAMGAQEAEQIQMGLETGALTPTQAVREVEQLKEQQAETNASYEEAGAMTKKWRDDIANVEQSTLGADATRILHMLEQEIGIAQQQGRALDRGWLQRLRVAFGEAIIPEDVKDYQKQKWAAEQQEAIRREQAALAGTDIAGVPPGGAFGLPGAPPPGGGAPVADELAAEAPKLRSFGSLGGQERVDLVDQIIGAWSQGDAAAAEAMAQQLGVNTKGKSGEALVKALKRARAKRRTEEQGLTDWTEEARKGPGPAMPLVP